MQDTNQQPDVPMIYIKPTRFDLVLEGVAVLLLLALWAIALGPFVFPDWYPERFDQSGSIIMAIMLTVIVGKDFPDAYFPRHMKSNFWVKITNENAERQYRLSARFSRYSLVWILLFWIEMSIRSLLPREKGIQYDHFGIYMGLYGAVIIWYIIRSRMLK